MSAISYMKRAVNRARQRGLGDMLAYSFSVLQNAAMNAYLDLRFARKIAGTRTTESQKLIPGVNQIMPTDWKYLENVFKKVRIKPDDVLVDVGCGDGRVISYWLSKGYKNKIVGIEIDPATARDVAKNFARYPNVEIACGDASEIALDTSGTIFYLFNSFLGEPLQRFERTVRDMGATIVLYSYNDLTPFAEWKVVKHLEPGQDPAYRFAVITRT